jgi:DNA-binding PadR family transcriptional regulator
VTDGIYKTSGIPKANSEFSLVLTNNLEGVILESPQALQKGLVAVGTCLDSHGQVLRTEAIQHLIREMNLEDFVEDNSYYKNTTRTATTIIAGLCKHGLFTRWMSPMRTHNRTGPTTKGYIITPHGRKLLADLLSTLPPVYQEKLNLVLQKLNNEPVNAAIEVDFSDPKVIQKLHENTEKIDRLTKDHECAINQASECDVVIAELKRKIEKEIAEYQDLKTAHLQDAKKIQEQIAGILIGENNDRTTISS